MARKLIDDCFRPNEASASEPLTHRAAIDSLRGRVHPIVSSEAVNADALVGRCLADAIVAPQPIPAHDNSAVDGYAFAHLPTSDSRTLPVVGVSAAGHPLDDPVPPGAAARILTGAVVPVGCDTVAMQEDCDADADNGTVTIPPGLKYGANVRPAGEDVGAGQTVFHPGHVVRPQDLAALASLGFASANCFQTLRVALFSTGDELRQPGSGPLVVGQVYDSNSAMLAALIRSAGAEPHHLGVLPDDVDEVRTRLADAASAFDIVLTSGGASAGSEDHIARVVADLGQHHHWRLNIKPGRPILFGQIAQTPIIGLPGNPVAVFVCSLLYVWPMLRALGGAAWPEPLRFPVPAGFAFKNRKRGRREYWRAWLEQSDSGLVAQKFARDGSGLISSLTAADGLIEIAEDTGDIAPGDTVTYIPLAGFGIGSSGR